MNLIDIKKVSMLKSEMLLNMCMDVCDMEQHTAAHIQHR